VDWFNEMYLRVSTALRSLRDREDGQGLVEYAVLVALITAGVIATIGFLGGDIGDAFDSVETAIDGVAGG
jgi:Flp pilus assembly pilin Flp